MVRQRRGDISPEGGHDMPKLSARNLTAVIHSREWVKRVDLDIRHHRVTSIVGPSGCGKSTFLRCLNRMHEMEPGARVQGAVMLDGEDIYGPSVDPVEVRRRIGMVFQKPTPFPRMNIRDNVLSGLRLTGTYSRSTALDVVEESLRAVALWEDVVHRLDDSVGLLSAGEQQRLCIARALAVAPEVLLMDEPCSALDPIATARIEDLLFELKERLTIVIVTHSMQQAARVSDDCAFFLAGELIETGPTPQLFTAPADARTEDYLTGRFG